MKYVKMKKSVKYKQSTYSVFNWGIVQNKPYQFIGLQILIVCLSTSIKARIESFKLKLVSADMRSSNLFS